GLEAYDAAERGGDADTTTTIGSYRACAHPGGHGRTGTARGTTWGQRGVVGVAGDAGQRTVGDRLPCDFRRGGLAHEHHAVLAQPSCHGRILLPGLVRPDRFGATQSRPAPGEEHVLDRDRHAVEQAFAVPRMPAL